MYLSFEQFDINILHVKAYMLEDINSRARSAGAVLVRVRARFAGAGAGAVLVRVKYFFGDRKI